MFKDREGKDESAKKTWNNQKSQEYGVREAKGKEVSERSKKMLLRTKKCFLHLVIWKAVSVERWGEEARLKWGRGRSGRCRNEDS